MIAEKALIKDLANCLAGTSNLIAAGSIPNANNFSVDLIKATADTVTNQRRLLVAFSGGPDSTALLLALQTIAPSFNFTVEACHINHGWRGQEADDDAAFCEQTCQQLNIKCKVVKLPLAQTMLNKHNRFSEDILRQMRYQSLQNFAQEEGIAFILAAHTLDDQTETILFRLFRGTALTGLKGIAVCRQLDNKVYLLRPLLNVTKQQCQQFLQGQNIAARHDSSNLDEIYNRNYIRHKIMPVISERFPDFTQHLQSMRQIIAAEDDLLANLAQRLFNNLELSDANNWPLELIAHEPLALQRRVVAYALQKREIIVSFARIEEILTLSEGDKAINLNAGWRVRNSQGQLLWQKIHLAANYNDNEMNNFSPLSVKVPGTNTISPLGMTLLIEPYKENNQTADQTLVDLSNIKPPLTLRLRQPGDIIRPLGMTQIVKLKKYLHTHKKVKADILLADQEEVLWLPGGGLSEKIKVTTNPSHVLQWVKLSDSPPGSI